MTGGPAAPQGPRPELRPLQAGDRVGLVSPSGPADAGKIDRAIRLLEEWGLEPVLGRHARDVHPRAPYLAGSDADRAADLQDLVCDDSIAAVVCLRGGYGAVRLLDLLDAGKLRSARPKPLIGSSDITALHEYWTDHLGLATWFTPMPATDALLEDPAARDGMREALFTPYPGRTMTGSAAHTLVPGTATGTLTGGNLSLLAMTLGTRGRSAPSNEGRIGLLEDVSEDIYKLDGLLTSLLRAGWFDGLAGLALGSWSQCGEPHEVRALVEELLVPLGIPLVEELGFGHGPAALSVPLGVPATLTADESPRLVLF
ncbi:S66 peptidase family protein [Arthrobacter zhaoguopingii]|uniref:S66 peptidase family protein n=1 Tax=Arthrobacter zhaoguopingii TaxID=2681491 RepID=UPI00135C0784|nr:LD-carboxypeptidase [Arthrobacter zhaoguopingii]